MTQIRLLRLRALAMYKATVGGGDSRTESDLYDMTVLAIEGLYPQKDLDEFVRYHMGECNSYLTLAAIGREESLLSVGGPGAEFRCLTEDPYPAVTDPDARKLASKAYWEVTPDGTLDQDNVSILADCLEDLDYDVSHLRELYHYRGCYVIDSIMGRRR